MATKINKPQDIFQIDVGEAILKYGCLMQFGSLSQLRSFLTSTINNGIYINLCLDGTFMELEDKTYVRTHNSDDHFYFINDTTIGATGIMIEIRKDPNSSRVVFKLALDYKKVNSKYYDWLETCYERMYIFGGKLFSLGSDLKLTT